MASKRGGGRGKYAKEVEEIRSLSALNKILKAGDMENALLSNSAKDSETMNENVLDDLLDTAERSEKGTERGLETIERLTTSGTAPTSRRAAARPAKKAKKAAKKRRR